MLVGRILIVVFLSFMLLTTPAFSSDIDDSGNNKNVANIDLEKTDIQSSSPNEIVSPVAAVNHQPDPSHVQTTQLPAAYVDSADSENVSGQQTVGLMPKSAGPEVGSGIVTVNPWNMVFGLFFVVLLIFVVAWLMRKMGSGTFMPGQSMKVLSALSVGTREKVVLVEVGEQQILLGVAPGRVSHLKDFDEPVITSNESGGEFSNKLKQLLGHQKVGHQKITSTGGG